MRCQDLSECDEYIADDSVFTAEDFEWLKNMTDEDFVKYIEELKKQQKLTTNHN